jgi:hypothetical protein
MCSRRVRSSFSTSDIRRVNLVTNPVISHERGKDRDDFNFPIVNFPFINIPAAPAYGVYISQLIRYSRACGSYQVTAIKEALYFKLNGIDAINEITKPRTM